MLFTIQPPKFPISGHNTPSRFDRALESTIDPPLHSQ